MACAPVHLVVYPFANGVWENGDAISVINRMPPNVFVWRGVVLNAFVEGKQHLLDALVAFWDMNRMEDIIISLVDERMDLLSSGLEETDIYLA